MQPARNEVNEWAAVNIETRHDGAAAVTCTALMNFLFLLFEISVSVVCALIFS